MATSYTGGLIFIGNLASMDTDESDFDFEDPSVVLQTFSSGMKNVTVTQSNPDDDNLIRSDDNGQTGETFSYTLGGTAKVSILDGASRYNATVTLADDSTQNVQVSIYQLQNGDTFVKVPFGLEIKSITMTSVIKHDFKGIDAGFGHATATVICFAAGTRIGTPAGPVPVEALCIGDMVMTLDNGAQPVRWIGKFDAQATEGQCPVRICADALGQGFPRRDLVVTAQHRMLVGSRIVQRMFGVPEVLVPAKKLVGVPGIDWADDLDHVSYVHFLCDQHELVFAEDAPSETLYPGSEVMKVLGPGAVLGPADFLAPPPVRPIARGKAQEQLAARHRTNCKPLLELERDATPVSA